MDYKKTFQKIYVENYFLKIHVTKRIIFKKSTLQIHLETEIKKKKICCDGI